MKISLQSEMQRCPEKLTYVTRITEIIGHPVLNMSTDKIDTRHSVTRHAEVNLTHGDENRVPGNIENLVWYTGGFKN